MFQHKIFRTEMDVKSEKKSNMYQVQIKKVCCARQEK